ncbi:MAG: EAL domain-containing protein [Oscillospiraceae bacterium]|nr:EAL domain-containing protein [Oscillospiraceae bacterium]
MKSIFKSSKAKYTVFLSLITALVVFAGLLYIFSVNLVLQQDNRLHFDEIASETANSIEHKLNAHISAIGSYAYRFSDFENLSENEQLAVLDEITRTSIFSDVVYIDERGNGLSSQFGEASLFQREYFRDGMRGNSSVSGSATGDFSNERMNMFYVPVMTGEEITGVLAGSLEIDYVSTLIDTDSFNGNTSSYVVDKSGSVVLKPLGDILHVETGVSLLESVTLTSDSELEILTKISPSETQGNFLFDYNDDSYFASYKAIDCGDWVVITVVRSSDILAVTHNVMSMMVIFTIVFTVIAATAIIITGIRNWKSKNVLNNIISERDNLKFIDPLTGGPSLERFIENVRTIFDSTAPETHTYAMISMDINKFRAVNDHLGYEEGNKILAKLAVLIERSLTEGETFTRKNADSFCILINYVSDIDIFGRIDTIISDVYYQIEEFKLILSFGICKVDDLTMDARSLIDRADLARRTIKGNNESSYAFFDNNMLNKIREEKRIENVMEYALESNEFKVYLQPKYDLNNHSLIIGAEALVRWFRGGKMIPPGGFIPIFEKNGFITKIDKFVFEEVCKQQKIWLNRGFDMRTISVNMSRMNLQEPHFVRDLYDICTKYNVPTKYFEIEITESVAFENLETLTRVFNELKNYGFHISIDDFGTGYSSLNMLKNLPVDVLKIDRSFLSDAKNERANNIISHVISLALSLHMKTICEGIETEEQVNLLSSLRCDMAQGFYFARPMPIEDYEKLLYSDAELTV